MSYSFPIYQLPPFDRNAIDKTIAEITGGPVELCLINQYPDAVRPLAPRADWSCSARVFSKNPMDASDEANNQLVLKQGVQQLVNLIEKQRQESQPITIIGQEATLKTGPIILPEKIGNRIEAPPTPHASSEIGGGTVRYASRNRRTSTPSLQNTEFHKAFELSKKQQKIKKRQNLDIYDAPTLPPPSYEDSQRTTVKARRRNKNELPPASDSTSRCLLNMSNE